MKGYEYDFIYTNTYPDSSNYQDGVSQEDCKMDGCYWYRLYRVDTGSYWWTDYFENGNS